MRLDLHFHHHYDDYRIRALLAELLAPILKGEKTIMALSAKLQAAVDAANAGVAQANTELEAIAAALSSQADVTAAAVATALAKAQVDEDQAAELINSARVSVQEHIDSTFATIGVAQPNPVPPVPVGPDPLVFAEFEAPGATVGQGYHAQLSTTGGTGTVVLGASPSTANGILFNSDGSFSGTPLEAGDTSFSITATDSASPPVTADLAVIISVAAAPVAEPDPLVVDATLNDGVVGQGYTAALNIAGGTPPYSVQSSPPSANGVSIDGAGNVSGTPTDPVDTSFSVTVTDSGSPAQVGTAAATLHVEPAPQETTQEGGATESTVAGGAGDDQIDS